MKMPSAGKSKLAFALSFASLALFAGTAISSDKQEIDVDGSFEHCQDSGDPKWKFFGPVDQDILITKENTHSGTYALRIPVSAAITGKITGAHQQLSSSLFKPGDKVTISGYIWHKLPFENGQTINLAFQIFGPDGKPLVYTRSKPKNIPGEWQYFTESVVVPQDFGPDCQVKVIASVSFNDDPAEENEILFDDISLTVEP